MLVSYRLYSLCILLVLDHVYHIHVTGPVFGRHPLIESRGADQLIGLSKSPFPLAATPEQCLDENYDCPPPPHFLCAPWTVLLLFGCALSDEVGMSNASLPASSSALSHASHSSFFPAGLSSCHSTTRDSNCPVQGPGLALRRRTTSRPYEEKSTATVESR